jgi:hypothetical protein
MIFGKIKLPENSSGRTPHRIESKPKENTNFKIIARKNKNFHRNLLNL